MAKVAAVASPPTAVLLEASVATREGPFISTSDGRNVLPAKFDLHAVKMSLLG